MTGRTHDLAAFTAISYTVVTQNIEPMTLATLVASLGANFIGALVPDMDQPTADLWRRVPAGTVFGKLLYPIMGGHRFISHSLLGIFLFGFGTNFLFQKLGTIVLVDMSIVWIAFMIGFISHLIMDTFTKDGVPWLFPIPIRFGIPPFKFLRFKTGGFVEKSLVFPGLMILNIYLFYTNYDKFIHIFKSLIK